jgi:hypothetical protein
MQLTAKSLQLLHHQTAPDENGERKKQVIGAEHPSICSNAIYTQIGAAHRTIPQPK